MQITKFSDIALRVMMGVAVDPERLFGISELSRLFQVSNNHMVKVVHSLVNNGYLASVRGRNGGVRIGKSPSKISLGEVIRATESVTKIIDCKSADCPLFPRCKLQGVLYEANSAFYKVLDGYKLSDLTKNHQVLSDVVGGTSAA